MQYLSNGHTTLATNCCDFNTAKKHIFARCCSPLKNFQQVNFVVAAARLFSDLQTNLWRSTNFYNISATFCCWQTTLEDKTRSIYSRATYFSVFFKTDWKHNFFLRLICLELALVLANFWMASVFMLERARKFKGRRILLKDSTIVYKLTL